MKQIEHCQHDRFCSWAVRYSNGNWKAMSLRPAYCGDTLQNLYRTVCNLCQRIWFQQMFGVLTYELLTLFSITTINGTVWLGQMNRKLSYRERNIYSEEWNFRWSLETHIHGKGNMYTEKSIPYYFEPAPPVQYNGISRRLSEQCGKTSLILYIWKLK